MGERTVQGRRCKAARSRKNHRPSCFGERTSNHIASSDRRHLNLAQPSGSSLLPVLWMDTNWSRDCGGWKRRASGCDSVRIPCPGMVIWRAGTRLACRTSMGCLLTLRSRPSVVRQGWLWQHEALGSFGLRYDPGKSQTPCGLQRYYGGLAGGASKVWHRDFPRPMVRDVAGKDEQNLKTMIFALTDSGRLEISLAQTVSFGQGSREGRSWAAISA